MKILIVCSVTTGKVSPFVIEQTEALKNTGVEVAIFPIKRKGLVGYLTHFMMLKKEIRRIRPHIIHAHYGLSGLLANLQRRVPVITTFHGSDINDPRNLKFSVLTHLLSAASIFVEESMMRRFKNNKYNFLIPCGIDTKTFYPIAKSDAIALSGCSVKYTNILFSSSFGVKVKNYPLAKEACDLVEKLTGGKIKLIELKGYSRQQVNVLLNSVDCALLTSFSEGSPQFIKEAMACNCPVVSTNVGDVRHLYGNVEGCYLTESTPDDVAEKIMLALDFSRINEKTKARDRIFELMLDSERIASRIKDVYACIIAKYHETQF